MNKHFSCLLIGFFTVTNLIAQSPATPANEVLNALDNKATLAKNSLVQNVPFQNIGPNIMSGRVADLDVNPNKTSEFYVAYASGGLWFTDNNGTTFEPVFDSAPTQNIGDIAIDWKNGTIWVGTGENNSSRSSYAGIGILKSIDHGKTWESVGLPDSHHIGRIILNPINPDEVVIGALGHLYSPNAERGVYKTKDGGKTWQKTLFIDENTGIIDVAFAPGNFQIQYAAAWQKDRKAWNFDGSGAGSGIYKSTDGGDSWALLTTAESGFPTGKGVGRIGLAVFDENTVYAVHDNQFHRPETNAKPKTDALAKDDFKTLSVEAFLNLDNKKLNDYLKNNGFQEKYRAENVKQLVRDGSVKPIDLAKYLEDANAQLFDTPVIGAEVYRSEDGGKTWKKTHEGYIDDLFYSYGYYFAQINVNPKDVNQIYLCGVPLIKSEDGGKTFKSIDKENVHSDHHALWIDPNLPGHLVNGNDGGVNITYDDGENWLKANDPAVGQFYYINVDNQKPYNVYGGLQDNGVWKGPNTYRASKSWQADGEYPYKEIMGGDGMQVQIDSRNANIVYTGFQFGNYYRLDLAKNDNKAITPQHDLGESPFRFNWQTPILLSPHNQDILYFGSNHLHRSLDKGDTWESISPDLTQGGKPGNVAYGTLTAISESPFQFGLIYIGTDDGNVQLTRNGGGSWENISASFPKDLWVSRVVASAHKKERVYASLNGYRWDDFKPYVYVSEDFGKTWKDISSNLPISPVNVIKEDPKAVNVLYVGTDDGTYVSFDRGGSWELFSAGLPKVAVHDLVIHPEANDLIIGTHGRSLYKADVAFLQSLAQEKSMPALKLSKPEDMRSSPRWGNSFSAWRPAFEPKTTFAFYTATSGNYQLSIADEKGNVLQQNTGSAVRGFNYAENDLTIDETLLKAIQKKQKDYKATAAKNGKYYLPKGKYTVRISQNGQTSEEKWEVK
jgi:photosystem II stability/assembly factor-like uncharacterized protein